MASAQLITMRLVWWEEDDDSAAARPICWLAAADPRATWWMRMTRLEM